MPPFELYEQSGLAQCTLVLSGELDLACAPTLDAALERACTDQVKTLTLDLSKLTFMDSTGLRAILLADDLCERHDCKLVVIPGTAQIQRLFEVTGLLERLPFQSEPAEIERGPVQDAQFGVES
jgi:anti-sigma B factor antagonist